MFPTKHTHTHTRTQAHPHVRTPKHRHAQIHAMWTACCCLRTPKRRRDEYDHTKGAMGERERTEDRKANEKNLIRTTQRTTKYSETKGKEDKLVWHGGELA